MNHPARSFVLRIRFETLALVAGAVAMSLALSHAVHQRADRSKVAGLPGQPAWTGRIADLPPDGAGAADKAITSASLVVPPATLALPANPSRQPPKAKPCESAGCPSKVVAVPPAQRNRTVPVQAAVARSRDADGLMSKLNPLNHLPDAVRHPFDVAGNTISGWLRRP